MMSSRGRQLWLFVVPAMLVMAATGIFPLVYSLRMSLYDYSPLREMWTGTRFVGLSNYGSALAGGTKQVGISFLSSLGLSAIFGSASLSIELMFGLCMAVLVSTLPQSGLTQMLRILTMIPILIAPVVTGSIFKFLFQGDIGLINHLLRLLRVSPPSWLGSSFWGMVALIVTSAWQWTAFSFLVFLAGMESIPRQLYEAASVDGAGFWHKFRYITLPGLKRVAVVIVLIRGIDLIRAADTVYGLTYGGPGTATSVLAFNAYIIGFKNFEIGEAAAYGYLMAILLNVFVFPLARYFFRGGVQGRESRA